MSNSSSLIDRIKVLNNYEITCSMKLFYLILAHQNIEQLSLLINTLQSPNVSFYVHYDKKSTFDSSLFQSLIKNSNNIYLISNSERVSINWGGFSQVVAVLKLLNFAAKRCANQEKVYFILLSGQDFPIKSNEYIYNYLKKNYGKEFIECFPLPDYLKWSMDGGMDRIRYYWFIDEIGYKLSYNLYEIQKTQPNMKPLLPNLQFFGGSQWWILSKACIESILGHIKINRGLVPFYRYSLIPDEIFFQTIVMNSSYAKYVYRDNLKYIDWKSGQELPKILDYLDASKVLSNSALFARKIDIGKSRALVDLLLQKIQDSD